MTSPTYSSEYYKKVYSEYFNHETSSTIGQINLDTMGIKGEFKYSLEIGAGLGQNLVNLQSDEKWAFDINQVSKEACELLGFTWVNEFSELPDNLFDLIFSRHALEHIENPFVTLNEIKSKISTAGIFILSVPIESIHMPKNLKDLDEHQHLYSWTPETLKNLLIVAGWEIIEMKIENNLFRRRINQFKKYRHIHSLLKYLVNRFFPLRSAELVAKCALQQTPLDQ